MSTLFKGNKETLNNRIWNIHKLRIENWLSESIYWIKSIDISTKRTPPNQSEINKDRFCIITNEEKIIQRIDKVLTASTKTTVAPSDENRARILAHTIEIVIVLLSKLEPNILNIIEAVIIELAHQLREVLKEKNPNKKTKIGIRDINVEDLPTTIKRKLTCINKLFQKITEKILIKYRDIIINHKEQLQDEEFTKSFIHKWNYDALLNCFNEIRTEIKKHETVGQDDEEMMDRQEMEEEDEIKRTLSVLISEILHEPEKNSVSFDI